MDNYTDYNDNKKVTYHEQTDISNILKLRAVLKTLPDFCKDYFRAMDPLTTTKTRISYAYDIRIFFQFLLDENPAFKDCSMKDFTVDVLDQLKAVDIEEYQEYLKVYKNGDKTETNGERGLKRKISALRSFYAYYYKHEFIQTNPTVLVDVPKTHEKSIIRLDADEVAMLLDYIEHCGDELTGQKRVYYEKTKERDLAIVTLLLGTGIRVSECVGLDVEDVDFKNNGIKVTRKGGNEMVVYFGHEVEKALKNTLKFAKISFLYPDTNTLSSILLKEKESVFRLLKTLSKNMQKLLQLQKKLRLISSAAPMVPPYIRKQVIFILWLTYWGIET